MWIVTSPFLTWKQSVMACPGFVFPNHLCKQIPVLSMSSSVSRKATFTSFLHGIFQSKLNWRREFCLHTAHLRTSLASFSDHSVMYTALSLVASEYQDGCLGHDLPSIWVPGPWKQWSKWKIHKAMFWGLITKMLRLLYFQRCISNFPSLCLSHCPSKFGWFS